jgi:hypothetical protein
MAVVAHVPDVFFVAARRGSDAELTVAVDEDRHSADIYAWYAGDEGLGLDVADSNDVVVGDVCGGKRT